MDTEKTARSRWLTRVLAVTLAVGGLAVGAASAASAAEGPVGPPEQAVAAPAQTAIPAPGDAGQDYWATDHCHYFAENGQWWSDMCLSRTADAAGNVIPYGLGTFQNLGDGLLGRELLDMDLSDPDHLVFSLVTPDGALGIRYRIAYSDPSRIEQEARTIDGQPTWITLPVYPPTPNGGPPQPTGDPVKDAQIAASWATYNQTLGMSWLLAAGADLRITV